MHNILQCSKLSDMNTKGVGGLNCVGDAVNGFTGLDLSRCINPGFLLKIFPSILDDHPISKLEIFSQTSFNISPVSFKAT